MNKYQVKKDILLMDFLLNYYNKKNNLNIIKKLIIKLNKNTDYLFNNKLINFKKIKKLEKYYNYIFIEINLNNKNIKYKKDNLFVARTFSSKARTMGFTLGTLTMLITLTLFFLNISKFSICFR